MSSKGSRFGFTIVEVLVTITIITIITTIIVRNQSYYVDAAALTNLSDEISSRLAQSQIYGIAVKESSPGSADFSGFYGLTFSLLAEGSNTSYLSFIDKNLNQIYDGNWSCPTGGTNECLEKVDTVRNNYIEDFCIIRTGGLGDLCGTVKRLDISFARPFVEARIKVFNSSGQEFTPDSMSGMRIVLRSQAGLSRTVSIYKSGQISNQ